MRRQRSEQKGNSGSVRSTSLRQVGQRSVGIFFVAIRNQKQPRVFTDGVREIRDSSSMLNDVGEREHDACCARPWESQELNHGFRVENLNHGFSRMKTDRN